MMNKLSVSNIVLLFLFCFTGGMLTAQESSGREFRAGASTSDITPWLGLPIVGGFGEPLAEHIHDPLYSKCLVLDDGTTKLVFVLIDNVGVPQWTLDGAKDLIHEETGIPKEHLMLAAVHNHSAVSAGGLGLKRKGYNFGKPFDDYQEFLVQRIVDGVRVAVNRLEPARIGWGSGSVPQHLFNRRYWMKEPVTNPFGGKDKVQMNPGVGNQNIEKPAGPTDPEVSFVSVQALDGRPISLLANYSLHYVGGVPRGHISGDYFAVFADRIQELLGADRQDPPFVGILSNGTSGDVNNIDFMGEREKHAPYEKMKIVADDVAEEVFKEYQKIEHHDWVELKAAQSELPLKIRRGNPELMGNVQRVVAREDDADPLFHRLEKAYADRVLLMGLEWPDTIEVPLQAFKIGKLRIAAIPFEVFTETGLEIKDKSPMASTFTIEIANGYYGYLPTPEQHELGGYETWLTTNKVQKDASEIIVREILSLFDRLE